jgi:hypothetical protein
LRPDSRSLLDLPDDFYLINIARQIDQSMSEHTFCVQRCWFDQLLRVARELPILTILRASRFYIAQNARAQLVNAPQQIDVVGRREGLDVRGKMCDGHPASSLHVCMRYTSGCAPRGPKDTKLI